MEGKDHHCLFDLVFKDTSVKLKLVSWSSSCWSLKINVFELAANVIYLFLGWRCNDGDDSSDDEDGGKMKHKENKEVLDINPANKEKVRYFDNYDVELLL